MTHHRLLAALSALALLLPTGLAGAVALHVAFEHRHEGDHSHEPSHVVRAGWFPHDDTIAADERQHGHAAALIGAGVVTCRMLLNGVVRAADGPASLNFQRSARHVSPVPRAATGPPKISGRPLLHRLSTLRI